MIPTRIIINIIPHNSHRMPLTAGDWYMGVVEDHLFINVSELPNRLHSLLIAVHELVEALLCLAIGVTYETVDAFDLAWGDKDGEPGDDPSAPYHRQHQVATIVERIVAFALRVDWQEYEAAIDGLFDDADA